jgi:hypothetical protein
MEIIKYYPELYVDIDASLHGVPGSEYTGNVAVRALSQTSRTLRGIFFPVLFERVHACFTARNRPKRKIKRRAKMLERRMIGIQKTPYVWPYIQYVTQSALRCHSFFILSPAPCRSHLRNAIWVTGSR